MKTKNVHVLVKKHCKGLPKTKNVENGIFLIFFEDALNAANI
jgi:hypothetical protein